jgi:MerR family transcriptional regulator, mercuric resistance operon regulatory protein
MGLTIGDVSEKTQVNIETIRYYERIWLVPAPPRSAGGRRQYDSAGIARLQFIRRARELGFSIDEIRALLAMTDGGAACGDVHALTVRHLKLVRAKIKDLKRMERTLAAAADRCALDASSDCPIIDALVTLPRAS